MTARDEKYTLEIKEDLTRGLWTGTLRHDKVLVDLVTGPTRELLIANALKVKTIHKSRVPGEIIEL